MTHENRPANCRQRLKDEGKAYPRSGCTVCGATIATGLGKCNTIVKTKALPNIEQQGLLDRVKCRVKEDEQWTFAADKDMVVGSDGMPICYYANPSNAARIVDLPALERTALIADDLAYWLEHIMDMHNMSYPAAHRVLETFRKHVRDPQ